MMIISTLLLLSAAVPIFAKQNHTDEPHVQVRQRRELSSMLSDLAGQFFRSGGQRGVDELSGSNDQMGVLKRYLGSAIAGMVFGNGNDLVSSILGGGSRGSGSSSSGGSGGFFPSASGSASSGSYSGGRTGVDVVDSRPGQRRTSSDSTGYGSDASETSGRRRPSSGGRDNDFEPQPGSNSKTGVSIINSRPDDRPRRPSGTRGASTSNSNRNVDAGDYDTDGVSGGSRGTEREQTGGSGYGRYSGNRRDDYK